MGSVVGADRAGRGFDLSDFDSFIAVIDSGVHKDHDIGVTHLWGERDVKLGQGENANILPCHFVKALHDSRAQTIVPS